MRFSGPFPDEVRARRQSEAAMRVIAVERGVPYPVPGGQPVGRPHVADPASAYATHALAVHEDLEGFFWCGVTSEVEALPPGRSAITQGGVVEIVRTSGPVKPLTDFVMRGPPP